MALAQPGGMATGVGLAVLYGLLAHASFRAPRATKQRSVLSLSFLIGVPVVLGVIATGGAATLAPARVAAGTALLIPWLACLVLAALALLFRWEARVAVIMALPLCLVAASAGGALGAALAGGGVSAPLRCGAFGAILVAPYLLAPVEGRWRPPDAFREQRSAILIAARPATIWRNVIRVPPLDPRERGGGLLAALGVPRPREATLSHEGPGGIRIGHFDRGVAFRETIVAWREEELLAFDLTMKPAGLADTPLRAIGGPHFDVLEVAYRLESLPDGVVLLHLASRIRVTTPFNRYAGLWLDAIMIAFQRSILRVIKARCER